MTVPSAPTGIGQYVKPVSQQGDQLKAKDMVNRPMIVWVREIKHLKRTRYNAEGGDAVFCDVVDLQTGACYANVMWMAGAIVDGLRPYIGTGEGYPTIIKSVEGGDYGSYNNIFPLEDEQWVNYASQNFAAFHASMQQHRAAKEAEWAQANANRPSGPPQPPAGPPAQPLAPVAPAAPQQAAPPVPPAQPQYQQPAPAAPPAAQVAPPQYQQPAPAAPPQAPAAPPTPPAQQPAAAPQYAAPGQAPAPVGAPPAPPAAPGAVNNDSIAQLQARLDQA